jgi:hypothetical protein
MGNSTGESADIQPGFGTRQRVLDVAHGSSQAGRESHQAWGAQLKRFFSRSVFWSYERGSWQYDVICALILVFIFLSPRSWFRDRPTLELTNLRHSEGIVEVAHRGSQTTYQMDSRLVQSFSPPLTTDEAIRQSLTTRLQRSVTIRSITPIRDSNGVVLGYTVVIQR